MPEPPRESLDRLKLIGRRIRLFVANAKTTWTFLAGRVRSPQFRERIVARLKATPTKLLRLGVATIVIVGLLLFFSPRFYSHLPPNALRVLSWFRWTLVVATAVIGLWSYLESKREAEGRTRGEVLAGINVILSLLIAAVLEPPPKVSAESIETLKTFNAAWGEARVDTDIEALARAVQLSGETDPLNLAQSALAQNQLDEAVRLFDRALLDFQPTLIAIAQTHVYKSLALSRGKHVSEALGAADAALVLSPGDVGAWLLRCTSLRKLAVPQLPSIPTARPPQTKQSSQTAMLEEARMSCERALELVPNFPAARGALGSVYLSMAAAEPEKAKSLLEKALASIELSLRGDPNDPSPWNNKAVALIDLERPAEALESAEEALRLKPDFADAKLVKGNALKRLDRLREAEELYRSMTVDNPSDVQAWNNVGDALLQRGHFEQALDAFNSALILWPNFEDSLYNRGLALFELGRYADAVDSFRRATEIDPKDDEAFLELANSLEKLGKYAEAMTALQTALDLRPDSLEGVQLKAHLLLAIKYR